MSDDGRRDRDDERGRRVTVSLPRQAHGSPDPRQLVAAYDRSARPWTDPWLATVPRPSGG